MTRHAEIVIPGGAYRLARARVPAVFLEETLPGRAAPADGLLLDIDVGADGLIAALAASGTLPAAAASTIDLEGRMVWPMLADVHTHLDKGQVIPRAMPDGTFLGATKATAADRAFWHYDDIRARMEFGLRCAYAHGVGAIRTHIDSNNEHVDTSWAVFRDLKREWAGRVELQGVALAPLTHYLTGEGARVADLTARSGGVLGGVTDGLRGDACEASQLLEVALGGFFDLAAERGLDIDLHTDQTDDPAAFSLPLIARMVMDRGFGHRVLCGHCVNLTLQTDEVIAQTAALCRDAGIGIACMPTPMLYAMDRMAGRTPRWRGVTAVNELVAAGVGVAIGGDNCRDAWFAYGDHDVFDTWRQGVRILHLDHALAASPAMVGPVPAEMMDTRSAGLIAQGDPARLIMFAARSLNELMCRPQADRIVIDRGRRVGPVPDYEELDELLGCAVA